MGFGLAIIVAIPLAMVMMRSAFLSRTLYPLLVVVQSTPVVTIAPIIVVALGAGDLPRVVITTLITFFRGLSMKAFNPRSKPKEKGKLNGKGFHDEDS